MSHDDAGIIWPMTIAPYQVVLVSMANKKSPEVAEAADQIYNQLAAAGIEVLYDDRDERPGVKFNDAELLGIPIRLTLGGRGLERGIVETQLRRNGEKGEMALETLVSDIQALIDSETALIMSTLKEEKL